MFKISKSVFLRGWVNSFVVTIVIFYFRGFLYTKVCVCDEMITWLHFKNNGDLACVCFCYVSQVFSCGEKRAGNCQTDFLTKIFLCSSIDSHLVESQVAPVQGLLQNSSSYYWSYLGPSSVWLFHLGKDVDRVL